MEERFQIWIVEFKDDAALVDTLGEELASLCIEPDACDALLMLCESRTISLVFRHESRTPAHS